MFYRSNADRVNHLRGFPPLSYCMLSWINGIPSARWIEHTHTIVLAFYNFLVILEHTKFCSKRSTVFYSLPDTLALNCTGEMAVT